MSLNSQLPPNAAAVTPSDTSDNTGIALYVGGAGNVAFETQSGQIVTFSNISASTIIPLRFGKVLATGTTATSLVRMW